MFFLLINRVFIMLINEAFLFIQLQYIHLNLMKKTEMRLKVVHLKMTLIMMMTRRMMMTNLPLQVWLVLMGVEILLQPALHHLKHHQEVCKMIVSHFNFYWPGPEEPYSYGYEP